MDYPCAKHGDFSLSCFGFIVRTDTYRQTDRQTDRITGPDDRYTDATTVGVSNHWRHFKNCPAKKNVSKESLSRFFKPLSRLPMRPKLNVVT